MPWSFLIIILLHRRSRFLALSPPSYSAGQTQTPLVSGPLPSIICTQVGKWDWSEHTTILTGLPLYPWSLTWNEPLVLSSNLTIFSKFVYSLTISGRCFKWNTLFMNFLLYSSLSTDNLAFSLRKHIPASTINSICAHMFCLPSCFQKKISIFSNLTPTFLSCIGFHPCSSTQEHCFSNDLFSPAPSIAPCFLAYAHEHTHRCVF